MLSERISIETRKSGLSRGWEWPSHVVVGIMGLSCVVDIDRIMTDVERSRWGGCDVID